eukprot:6072800-Amphidinium_carterae.1
MVDSAAQSYSAQPKAKNPYAKCSRPPGASGKPCIFFMTPNGCRNGARCDVGVASGSSLLMRTCLKTIGKLRMVEHWALVIFSC